MSVPILMASKDGTIIAEEKVQGWILQRTMKVAPNALITNGDNDNRFGMLEVEGVRMM